MSCYNSLVIVGSTETNMVVSLNRGPQYKPQNAIILIMGTPKIVPLILGNPHMSEIEGLGGNFCDRSDPEPSSATQGWKFQVTGLHGDYTWSGLGFRI